MYTYIGGLLLANVGHVRAGKQGIFLIGPLSLYKTLLHHELNAYLNSGLFLPPAKKSAKHLSIKQVAGAYL